MNYTETKLSGCFLIEPKVFYDNRGNFMESFNLRTFRNLVQEDITFVQDNLSFSRKGVIRALHYQVGEMAQAKLVQVLKGEVLDVAVDLRSDSPTFGEHYSVVLSSDNKKQLFIPRGFAHGFLTLSEEAIFFYKCDNYYDKASEGGIIYNDPFLNIDWGIDQTGIVLSEKDKALPIFNKARL